MSNLRLQGNPSGTGTLTIASPNTNSDFTLNLPASGGTIPVLSSVTNNGVVFINSSGQATSGSALTFDGSVLGVGAAIQSGFGRLQVRNGYAYVNEDGSDTYQLYLRSGFGGTLPAVQAIGGPGLGFVLGSTEQMRLTTTGLGIGTSSPTHRLQITNTSSSGFSTIRMQSDSRSYDVGVAGSTSGFQPNNWYVFDVNASVARMVVDTGGRVTMPAQPAFHSERNTAFNAASGVIVFENAPTNIGSNYNTSTGRFTAPVAGTYIFLVSFFTNITNAPIDFRITVNGATVGGNATTGTTSVARDCHAHLIRTLAVNDYVEVQAAGFGVNIPSSLGIFQNFSGRLVS